MTRFFPGLRDPFVCAGLLLAVGLYTAALFLPALRHEFGGGSPPVLTGREAVLLAPELFAECLREAQKQDTLQNWAQALSWLFRGWLPNVLLWLGLLCLAASRRHLPWALGAFALYEGVFVVISASDCRVTPLISYYAWMGSMALLTAVGAYRALWPRDRAGLVTAPAS